MVSFEDAAALAT